MLLSAVFPCTLDIEIHSIDLTEKNGSYCVQYCRVRYYTTAHQRVREVDKVSPIVVAV